MPLQFVVEDNGSSIDSSDFDFIEEPISRGRTVTRSLGESASRSYVEENPSQLIIPRSNDFTNDIIEEETVKPEIILAGRNSVFDPEKGYIVNGEDPNLVRSIILSRQNGNTEASQDQIDKILSMKPSRTLSKLEIFKFKKDNDFVHVADKEASQRFSNIIIIDD